jgi:hypothetical protein
MLISQFVFMSHETGLSNTMYDILHAMGKDAGFLYETIDTYVKDAQNANSGAAVVTITKIDLDPVIKAIQDAYPK